MSGQADTSMIHLRQGEILKVPDGGRGQQEVTCDDLARLALAIHDHRYFFSLRRGLDIRFSRDLNGSGTQALYVRRKSGSEGSPPLMECGFDRAYGKDDQVLYEADLIMDQRKDYEPALNRGQHPFAARSATLRAEWFSDEIKQYRSDIERLSRTPDTLRRWIDDGLEMQVNCSLAHCRKPTILENADLERYHAAGLSLDDLKSRLKCSKCGRRGAELRVF